MFIGENQPHVFRNNPVEDGRFVEAISIYFNRNAFGANFFQLPEVRMISKFLDRTAKGIDVTGNTRTYLEEKIMRLGSLSGFRRFSQFLEILDVCAGSSELVPLSDFGVELVGRDHDADRLNKVFNHVFSHLHEDIHLQDIASMVHLTPGGFCRFFRKKTRKSFFGFLIEVRISKSMELLRETGSTVSECAFDSGFRNLSHFNREFLRITAMTPTVYRQQFTVRK
jgi:AraC-like DNA-binding protein